MSSSLCCDQPQPCSSSCNLKNADGVDSIKLVDAEQWEEIRCPICMEPPHNALLLRCSSFKFGCRAYVCDTSYRHTNCFDGFAKTRILVAGCVETPTMRTVLRPEDILVGDAMRSIARDEHVDEDGMQQKLLCPLCRGEIYEVVKVNNVREFLNSKVRNCSSETCNFSGTYVELRKHARTEHPDVQPAEADPGRLREWERVERAEHERDLQSAMINPSSAEDLAGGSAAYRDLLNCFLSIAYYTTQRDLNMLDSRSQSLQHYSRIRRQRPQPRPRNSSVVDPRTRGRIGIRQPLPSPFNRGRRIWRHGGTNRLVVSFSGGERRFRGYGESEQLSNLLGRRGDFNRRRRDR